MPGGDELVLDGLLDVLHRPTLVGAYEHGALGEALEVGHVLRLLQLHLVVLALDLELLAHDGRAAVAELGDVDDGDGLEAHHLLVLHAVFGPQRRLLLEVLDAHEVRGRVGWHGRHHARPLVHEDGEHREHGQPLVYRVGALELDADEVLPLHLEQALRVARRAEQVLERHVARGPGADDDHLAASHEVAPVVPVREHPAVGLAVHRLRPERRGAEEHLPAREGRERAHEVLV
mmetsp:Transcript_21907/g.74456  ORF Transcript_21907/g.74456 Transcript_21907/m.74456 type:complete len:233 (+) Transcript_21907:3348-4046(+)